MKSSKLQFKVKNCENIQRFLILVTMFLLPFYFVKFKYGWISLNLIEVFIIVLFLTWLFSKEKKYQIPNTKYHIPVVLIIAGLVFSAVANKNYFVGLGVIKGWFVLPIIFAFILYDHLKRDERLLDKVFIALFASGAFVAAEGIYYWLSGLVTYDGRLRMFFDSPNQLAMFLAPAFLAGMYFTQHPLHQRFNEASATRNTQHKIFWKIILFLAGLAIISLNLYLTKSYGSWLAVGSALVVVFWLKYRKKSQKKYLFIFFALILISLVWAGFSKYDGVKMMGERSSLTSRVMIWKSAGLMIEKNPIFGIGPGNFQVAYLEYQKYFPPYLEWAVPQPHNLYLAFWLEAGFAGLVGFIWLMILFFWDNKKTRQGRDSLEAGRENNSRAALACLSIMLYFLIHGLVDTTYWRNDMAVVFWMIVAINLHLSRQEDESKASTKKISNAQI